MRTVLSCVSLLFAASAVTAAGVLQPRDTPTRESYSLNGYWDFTVGDANHEKNGRGYWEKWYEIGLKAAADIPIQLMPVPSSFNDITASWELRDFFGVVWYEKTFFVPRSWEGQRVWLRFSSVCYYAEVWVNGEFAVSHEVGHLPFQTEVTSLVTFGLPNTISVAVNNTLSKITIPQGQFSYLESGRYVNTFSFDFWNYAGIDRPVTLFTTPQTYIDDVAIATSLSGTTGVVRYTIAVGTGTPGYSSAHVTVYDEAGAVVSTGTSALSGTLTIPNAHLWWPHLMDPDPGYLYRLEAQLLASDGSIIDQYTEKFGIRTLSWDANNLLINNRPIYFRGFGRHEDIDIKGTGVDFPFILRDLNLIKWSGANAVRTSNYPYSDEFMDLADELGILVIEESPAVETGSFNNLMQQAHVKALQEMVNRDKNRPSVIMWSVAANARVDQDQSVDYFQALVDAVRARDTSRPVTAINTYNANADHVGGMLDIACFNSFTAWDGDQGGRLDIILPDITALATDWHTKYNIPVIMTEYGADSMEGLHFLPAYIWSEEYQSELLSNHFQAFDQLRGNAWFIGEFIWNFADFKSKQDFLKVGGTKKGIFSRSRQPKSAAYLLRRRYWNLAQELDGVTPPDDLDYYTSRTVNRFQDPRYI